MIFVLHSFSPHQSSVTFPHHQSPQGKLSACAEHGSNPFPFVRNVLKYFPRAFMETRASSRCCCCAGTLRLPKDAGRASYGCRGRLGGRQAGARWEGVFLILLIGGTCICPRQVCGTWVWILVAATSVAAPLLQGWVMYVSVSSWLISLLLLLSYLIGFHKNSENWKVLVRKGWDTGRCWQHRCGHKTTVAGDGWPGTSANNQLFFPPFAPTRGAGQLCDAITAARLRGRVWCGTGVSSTCRCWEQTSSSGRIRGQSRAGFDPRCSLVSQDSLYHGATAILYMSAAVLQANATIMSEPGYSESSSGSSLHYQLNSAATVSRSRKPQAGRSTCNSPWSKSKY